MTKKIFYIFGICVLLAGQLGINASPALAASNLSLSIPAPYVWAYPTSYTGTSPYNQYWALTYRFGGSGGPKAVTVSATGCPTNSTCRFTNDTNNTFSSGNHSFTQTINPNTDVAVNYEIKFTQDTPVGMHTITFSLSAGGETTVTKLGAVYVRATSSMLNVPGNLYFYGTVGQAAPAAKYFSIFNYGVKNMDWAVTPDQSWCTVTKADGSPASGNSIAPGESIGLKVTVDAPVNHAPGTYTCKLNGSTTTADAYAFTFSTGAGTVVYSVFNSPAVWSSRTTQCNGHSFDWAAISSVGATYTLYRNINNNSTSTAAVVASGINTTSYFTNNGLSFPRISGGNSVNTAYYYWVLNSVTGVRYPLYDKDTGYTYLGFPLECGNVSLGDNSSTSTFTVNGVQYVSRPTVSMRNVGFTPITVTSSIDNANRCYANNATVGNETLNPGDVRSVGTVMYSTYKPISAQLWCTISMTASTGSSISGPNYIYAIPGPIIGNSATPAYKKFVWDNSVCNQISVKWKGSGDATNYNVYRAPYVANSYDYHVYDSSGSMTFLANVKADPYSSDHLYNYTDTSVVAGQAYVYRVEVGDNPIWHSPSSDSEVDTTYPNGITPTSSCAAPPSGDLKANGSDGPIVVDYDSTVQLTWTSANTTTCTASGSWSGNKALNGTEDQTNVTVQKTYTLTCSNASGQQVVDTITVNVKPQAPQNVNASNTACEQITVTWNAVSGATSYTIYRNTTSNIPALPIATNVNGTLYADTVASGQYYYWVSAVNDYGESPKTAIASASVFAPACTAGLSNSDLDIAAVNFSSLPNNSQNPDCNGPYGFNISPANKSDFKSGDIVTFEVNVCNDQGQALAQNVQYTAYLTNLSQPENGWNVRVNGSSANDPTITNNTVSPNQTLVFDLGNVPKGQVKKLLFDAKITLPLAMAYELAYSRFTQRGVITFNQPGGETQQVNLNSSLMLFSNTQSQPTKVEVAP